MRADFSKFLGPQVGEEPAYVEPKDAKPLVAPDASTVSTIRHKLAIREVEVRAADREAAKRAAEREKDAK